VDDHILPRVYDMMIYGVQTLIDPDRYELFDSTQIAAPGLNLSCYTSIEKRTQVVNGTTEKVPAVDDDLDDARRIVDETARAKKYKDFQEIIGKEVPAVFLYYPQEFYLVNKRVANVTLTNITSIEQRFDNIANWRITVD
jgi:ABC-type transport system substrate-binding protein